MRNIILFFMAIFFLPSLLLTHGVNLKATLNKPFINIQSTYSGGKVMAGCQIMIEHEDEFAPFQTGQTDKNGHFIFKPDSTGVYIITVDDQLGHKGSLNIKVDRSFFSEPGHKNGETGTEAMGIKKKNIFQYLFGVTLILFLTLLFYSYKKKTDET